MCVCLRIQSTVSNIIIQLYTLSSIHIQSYTIAMNSAITSINNCDLALIYLHNSELPPEYLLWLYMCAQCTPH